MCLTGDSMIISHRHKFIFIRPRKVAGTSIEIVLSRSCRDDVVVLLDRELRFDNSKDTDYFDPVLPQNVDVLDRDNDASSSGGVHLLPGRVRAKYGAKVWDEYFKFTAVRNPWDQFVSYYYYNFCTDWPGVQKTERGSLRNRYLFWRARRHFETGHHKENIEFSLKKSLPFARRMAEMPKFHFIDGGGGQEYADYVIRFENLQKDFDEVCRLLGIRGGALPRTKSKFRPEGDDYRNYYTDYSRAHIASECRRLIDTFGYRFDERPASQ